MILFIKFNASSKLYLATFTNYSKLSCLSSFKLSLHTNFKRLQVKQVWERMNTRRNKIPIVHLQIYQRNKTIAIKSIKKLSQLNITDCPLSVVFIHKKHRTLTLQHRFIVSLNYFVFVQINVRSLKSVIFIVQ